MRVMLWCDMEGIAGISVWEQVNGGAALYEEGRRLYTAEVNPGNRAQKFLFKGLSSTPPPNALTTSDSSAR